MADKTVPADAGVQAHAACPRCGGGFACGAASGRAACDCFGIRLSDALRAELAARYPGRCLCLHCLGELAGGAAQA